MPKLSQSFNLLWGGGPARTFADPIPDLIIIALGHNDGGADQTGITPEAVAVLTAMLAATPITTQILVFRPLVARQAAPLQAAVAQVASGRVRYVDTTGWFAFAESSDSVHPYGFVNTRTIAPKAAEAVRGVIDRRTYINKGGVALPVTPNRL